MLPAYDTVNLPEEKTMTIFLGYLFARLIESSSQVRAAIRIQRFVRRARLGTGSLKKPSRSLTLSSVRNNPSAHHPDHSIVKVLISHTHAARIISRRIATYLQQRKYCFLRDNKRHYDAEAASLCIKEDEERILRAEAELIEKEAALEVEKLRIQMEKETARIALAALEADALRIRLEEEEAQRCEKEVAAVELALRLEEEEVQRREKEVAAVALARRLEEEEAQRREKEDRKSVV